MEHVIREVLKAAYKAVPGKRFAFAPMRALPLPASIYQHLHFKGPFRVDVPGGAPFRLMSGGDVVENKLFWKGLAGDFEATSLEIWRRLARVAEGAVLDIGANTGVYALLARAVNPSAQIIAFEPVARVAARLRGNIALNQASITVREAAVSDHSGTATLHDSAPSASSGNGYSASLETDFAFNIHSYQVPVCALDDEPSGPVGLIKLDVEMHEPAAVRGMARLLAAHRPAMLIEVLTAEIGEQLAALLQPLGYSYYQIIEGSGIFPIAVPARGGERDMNILACTGEQFARAGLDELLIKAQQ